MNGRMTKYALVLNRLWALCARRKLARTDSSKMLGREWGTPRNRDGAATSFFVIFVLFVSRGYSPNSQSAVFEKAINRTTTTPALVEQPSQRRKGQPP